MDKVDYKKLYLRECEEVATLRAKLTQVEQDRDRLAADVERLKTKEPGKFIAEIEHEYAVKTNNLIERHAAQLAAAQEESKRLEEKVDYSTEVDLRMHKRYDDLYEQH